MRRRLPLVLALVLVVAGAATAIVLLARDEPASTRGLPLGDDGFAARTSVAPRSHHFGDTVRVRLDLLVDREVLDPADVVVTTKFAPFAALGPVERSRSDHDRLTRLRFEFHLDCLGGNCVPDTLTKDFDLTPAVIRHRGEELGSVEWPRLTIASRVGDFDPAAEGPRGRSSLEVPWRATLRLSAPTYSLDPTLLTVLLVALALVLLAASLFFVQQAFPAAPLGLRWRRRTKLTPLERALIVLERAHESGIEREQRLALDRVAHELRSGGHAELAGAARRLAWEHDVPGPDRTATLADQIRALTAGRSNGRA